MFSRVRSNVRKFVAVPLLRCVTACSKREPDKPPSEHSRSKRPAVPVWDFLNAQTLTALLPRRSISAPANAPPQSMYESSVSLPQASISAPRPPIVASRQPCLSPPSSNQQIEGSRSQTPHLPPIGSTGQSMSMSRAEPSISKSISSSHSASREIERSITKSRTHAHAYHPSLSPISSIGEDDGSATHPREHSEELQPRVVASLLDSIDNADAASAQQLAAVALRARLQAQELSVSIAAAGGAVSRSEQSDGKAVAASLYNGCVVRRVVQEDDDARPRVDPLPVPKVVLEAERAAATAAASASTSGFKPLKSAAPMPDDDSVNHTSAFPSPSSGNGGQEAKPEESVSPAQLARILEQRAIERKKALPPCLVCGVILPSNDEFVDHMKMHHEVCFLWYCFFYDFWYLSHNDPSPLSQ